METKSIKNEWDYKEREIYWKTQDAEKAKHKEINKKNNKFTQLYDEGIEMLDYIIDENPKAARLYMYFMKHMDKKFATVIISQRLLAKHLGCSRKTIIRYCKFLADCYAIVQIKVEGTLSIYCLNPNQVWKSWNSNKNYSPFNLIDQSLDEKEITLQAAVIIDKKQNKNVMYQLLNMLKVNKEFMEIQKNRFTSKIEKHKEKNEFLDLINQAKPPEEEEIIEEFENTF